jgi:hypothetical protein
MVIMLFTCIREKEEEEKEGGTITPLHHLSKLQVWGGHHTSQVSPPISITNILSHYHPYLISV